MSACLFGETGILTRTGEGRTAYGRSICVTGWVDAYRLTLALGQGWHRLFESGRSSLRFLRRW